MTHIEFTKGFAGRSKGDLWACDGMLAHKLVRVQKVAKFTKEQIAFFDEYKAIGDKQAKTRSDNRLKEKKAREALYAKARKKAARK